MQEKKIQERDREATEQKLLDAAFELAQEIGFERLGVNAVAARAGVSKVLVYRYFGSLDGLLEACVGKLDFWTNYQHHEPQTREEVVPYLKAMFRAQAKLITGNRILQRLYRWELLEQNAMLDELHQKRGAQGRRTIEVCCRLTGCPPQEMMGLTTVLVSSLSYLGILSEHDTVFNGIRLDEEGWQKICGGVDALIEAFFEKHARK